MIQIRNKLQEQMEFFNNGSTRDIKFRIRQLEKLGNSVKKYEGEILKALYADLKKSAYESYMTEIGFVLREIRHTKSNLKKWAKPEKVKTPFVLGPGKSRIISEPYGQILIISPWNYPFQLAMVPLISAIAAGNVAVIKPSELAPSTSAVIAEIISDAFNENFVFTVEGGVERAQFLLSEKFDYIFFTGSREVGKMVMESASRFLTPVTLELGGKSPVIVNKDASINSAAKKIVWGKFLNAGQTCVAPDYLLVHRDVREKLIERIEHYIKVFYSDDPSTSIDYSRIINSVHFKRIKGLLDNTNIIAGGKTSGKQLYISPTIVDRVSLNHPLMKEEIFGPVLPVLEFRDINEAVNIVKSMPKPLALYLFTSDRKTESKVINEISSGSVMINDTVLQVSNEHLPFGGVGESGMGACHGKSGFDAFSHKKSVMKRSGLFDIPLRYPPFNRGYGLLRKLSG
ncbi:MAG: aldehyde dehydrogenase [Spirochaetes bacterium]|nr:aldehyde dehydrogenase [Spirochaetota bacterium]